MKDKIIIFLVGLLLGAFISTGSIYMYTIANNGIDDKADFKNDTNTPPEIPNENRDMKEGNI